MQGVLEPGLAKEGGDDEAGLVRHRHLDDGQVGTRRLELHLFDAADAGDVCAHVRKTYRRHLGEVEIAPRQMIEQVAHGVDSEAPERLSPLARTEAQRLHAANERSRGINA